MYLKAALFLVAGVISATILFTESPHGRTAFLLSVMVWSFCRLYYFAFYVIEKYIDPGFRFDGLGSFAAYLWRQRIQKRLELKTPAVHVDRGRSHSNQ